MKDGKFENLKMRIFKNLKKKKIKIFTFFSLFLQYKM